MHYQLCITWGFREMNQHYVDRLLSLMTMSDKDRRSQEAKSLWDDVVLTQKVPIVQNNKAYFLHYGDANQVLIAGDWTFWQPALILERIQDTKLFYAIHEFPDTARLQYKTIINGNWILDPANRRTSIEGFGMNSEFWMPRYKDESYQTITEDMNRGDITRHSLYSNQMKQQREIFCYLPPNYQHQSDIPLLLIQDGSEAISIGHFNTVLDNLISQNIVRSCAAVFIPPIDRMYEYPESNAYPRFIAEEVIPFVRAYYASQQCSISHKPQDTAITGASLGGLVSTKIALQYPDIFGVCIPQSPSYWWNHGDIYNAKELRNANKIHFILQTGTICDARQLTLRMLRILQSIGANVDYQEYHQGHTWGNWRSNFAYAMKAWLSDNLRKNKAA